MSASPESPLELLQRALHTLRSAYPVALDLGRVFEAAGHELALVGGPVRDAFLASPTADLDFATSAHPDETERLLDEWADATWAMGKEFGTIGARKGDVIVEVTTYRTDEYDSGSRKPVVAFGDSLDGDLSRRDFTVNAMAVRLPDLTFVDPFGGLSDLAARRLRTPVTAEQSFDDDPLRMLRAARFTSQLGFVVDDDVVQAMTAQASRLEIVSAERIQGELVKLLLTPRPRMGLELMTYTGIADVILPEVPGMQLAIDADHHHKDVYEHSLTVLDQAIELETGPNGPVPTPDLVLRLAALLHDIGKPATRKLEPGGGVSFHHHEVVGAKMAAKRMRALKFDKATITAVTHLIALHLRFHGYGEQAWTDSAVRRYVTDAGEQLERLHRLTRADCTTKNRRKAARLAHAYDDLERRIIELGEQEELKAIRPDLDGQQIMEILGITPGPQVGRAYRFLLELRMDEGPLGEDVARQRLVEWWAQQG